MVAIGRMTESPLHHIADEAAIRTGSGGIHPQARAAILKKLEQLTLCHARFNGHIGEFFVEVHDTVHPAEVDNDVCVARGHARSIAPVFAAAYGIYRDPKMIGDAHT